MIADQRVAASDHARALASADRGILHKVKRDLRVTPIGALLPPGPASTSCRSFQRPARRDEPRRAPAADTVHAEAPPGVCRSQGLVRPGITGLWQIRDREHNTSAEFMIEHDLEYVARCGLRAGRRHPRAHAVRGPRWERSILAVVVTADFIVVGSGLTGSTIARLLTDHGQEVVILERKDHIAGNVYDYRHESGALIHQYGPHYFRCGSERIWRSSIASRASMTGAPWCGRRSMMPIWRGPSSRR